jgi:hypothetical protein
LAEGGGYFGFCFGGFEVEESIRGFVFFFAIFVGAAIDEMDFDFGGGIVFGGEVGAVGFVGEDEAGVFVVGDAADFGSHDAGEKAIYEIENAFVAAPVAGEIFAVTIGPLVFVIEEDGGIGLAEAVDALFDVADEKAIAGWAGDGGDDFILGVINVLVFVHENPLETGSAIAGGGGVFVVEEFEGELFEVGEIDEASLAFELGELVSELFGDLEEEQADGAGEIPIFLEWI